MNNPNNKNNMDAINEILGLKKEAETKVEALLFEIKSYDLVLSKLNISTGIDTALTVKDDNDIEEDDNSNERITKRLRKIPDELVENIRLLLSDHTKAVRSNELEDMYNSEFNFNGKNFPSVLRRLVNSKVLRAVKYNGSNKYLYYGLYEWLYSGDFKDENYPEDVAKGTKEPEVIMFFDRTS